MATSSGMMKSAIASNFRLIRKLSLILIKSCVVPIETNYVTNSNRD